ncbi:MAG: EAL domain-containing protein [Desulfobacteraceae bacterium]|nr:EAL domain-containing protein [Desulfobacteraceae bacterium]
MIKPNSQKLSKIFDWRPTSILKEIAVDQKKFALIFFDIAPETCGVKKDELINKINNIFGMPDITIWLDENQLIILSSYEINSIKLTTAIKQVEQILKCKTGVVFYPEDGKSLQILATKAYQATRLRGNQSLRKSIHKALDDNEFFLVYQPQINTKVGNYTGVEALIRWQSKKDQRIIMPSEFLPIAETEGMMDLICKWTLYEACRQSLAWQLKRKELRISVNISTTYLLNPVFLNDLDQVLEETGINPSFLELEITENKGITKTNVDKVNVIIQSVRNKGILVSLDDFGMEYNSLEVLRILTVDKIKIDKVFVQNIETQKVAFIIQATISLARAMGLECIAEGVECIRQATLLERMGCFDMQGYLFGKPEKGYPKLPAVLYQ